MKKLFKLITALVVFSAVFISCPKTPLAPAVKHYELPKIVGVWKAVNSKNSEYHYAFDHNNKVHIVDHWRHVDHHHTDGAESGIWSLNGKTFTFNSDVVTWERSHTHDEKTSKLESISGILSFKGKNIAIITKSDGTGFKLERSADISLQDALGSDDHTCPDLTAEAETATTLTNIADLVGVWIIDDCTITTGFERLKAYAFDKDGNYYKVGGHDHGPTNWHVMDTDHVNKIGTYRVENGELTLKSLEGLTIQGSIKLKIGKTNLYDQKKGFIETENDITQIFFTFQANGKTETWKYWKIDPLQIGNSESNKTYAEGDECIEAVVTRFNKNNTAVADENKEALLKALALKIYNNGTINYTVDLNDADILEKVAKVTDMSRLFSLQVPVYETDKIVRAGEFGDAVLVNLKEFTGDLSSWDVNHVTNKEDMFLGSNMDPLPSWYTGSTTTVKTEFPTTKAELIAAIKAKIATDGKTSNLNHIDTSKITDMSELFNQWGDFPGFNGDISEWDTSSVTTMSYMFSGNGSVFNQDISSWDTSNVTNFSGMFNSSKEFNQDISEWNVNKAINMSSMFEYASTFNQDLSSWDLTNVSSKDSFKNGAVAWTKPKPKGL